jgi:hypothetical protein
MFVESETRRQRRDCNEFRGLQRRNQQEVVNNLATICKVTQRARWRMRVLSR